MYQYQKELRN